MQMFETGCDGVMIGRAAIGNPWIFRETRHFLATGEHCPPPTIDERLDVCARHLKLSVDHKGERRAVTEFRKYYAGYLKGQPNAAKFRVSLMAFTEAAPILERLEHYRDSIAECATV